MSICREKIMLNGLVQGVGFRPFVYNLARRHALSGHICNSSAGVRIEIEGFPRELKAFRSSLRQETPPLAEIVTFEVESVEPKGERTFTIIDSDRDHLPDSLISPDISICEDCLAELFNPADRRYRYPFINCTNCGPRYTIVRSIPYDRPFTSMAEFPLCEPCQLEYDDPENRRFHAQPNACPRCGPKLSFRNSRGEQIETQDAVRAATQMLRNGKIVAIRGLGGFHLAVNAFDEKAVQKLRYRKGRYEKPFALMAPDMEMVRRYCTVSADEQALLQSRQRPIVILQGKKTNDLAPSIAPGTPRYGFMLPYTPLHYLLLRDNFDALVMTSANYAEEPIAIGNEEVVQRLAGVADYFLLHNREILQRCDDSIVNYSGGEMRFLRRSRGYVPKPVFLKNPVRHAILACGAELKNTIGLARQDKVFLSQHIGDLDNPAAYAFYKRSIKHLQEILGIVPEAVAFDLHPEYLSTKWAMEQNEIPGIAVQHHHAHLASVLAENRVEDPAIGIILDGTGYGTDGTIWGGEVLIGDASDFNRFAWLSPVSLPGGAAAIREPWRMAISFLKQAFGDEFKELDLPVLKYRSAGECKLIEQMIDKNINAPLTTSCGRLFDGIAAIIGIRNEVTYEAQAAIEMEMCIDASEKSHYENASAHGRKSGELDVSPLIRAVVRDLQKGVKPGSIVARFHRALAELFLASAVCARDKHQINNAALSGGVFQNRYFFDFLKQRLQDEQFRVITHRLVPANDGGIALGQVAIADKKLQEMK